MRQSFIENGSIEGLPDHNILEFILFFAVPRADTNELAHTLINKFGSLSGVFDAPYEALIGIKGIGERSATLLKLLPSIAEAYSKSRETNNYVIKSVSDAVQYLTPRFASTRKELLLLICLNRSGCVLNCSKISTGEIDRADIDIKKLLRDAIYCNASEIIIAHNHPGGIAAPSRSDIDTTIIIANTIKNTGIFLHDHIIISDDDYISFAETPVLRKYLNTERKGIVSFDLFD